MMEQDALQMVPSLSIGLGHERRKPKSHSDTKDHKHSKQAIAQGHGSKVVGAELTHHNAVGYTYHDVPKLAYHDRCGQIKIDFIVIAFAHGGHKCKVNGRMKRYDAAELKTGQSRFPNRIFPN
jgi:hypothetical protein